MEAENTMEMIKDEEMQEEAPLIMYELLNKCLLSSDSVLAQTKIKVCCVLWSCTSRYACS